MIPLLILVAAGLLITAAVLMARAHRGKEPDEPVRLYPRRETSMTHSHADDISLVFDKQKILEDFIKLSGEPRAISRVIQLWQTRSLADDQIAFLAIIQRQIDSAAGVIEREIKLRDLLTKLARQKEEERIKQVEDEARIAEADARKQKALLEKLKTLAEIAEVQRYIDAENMSPEEAEEATKQRMIYEIKKQYGKFMYSLQAVDDLYDKLRVGVRENPDLTPTERNKRLKILRAACEKIKEELLQRSSGRPSGGSSNPQPGTGPGGGIYEEND